MCYNESIMERRSGDEGLLAGSLWYRGFLVCPRAFTAIDELVALSDDDDANFAIVAVGVGSHDALIVVADHLPGHEVLQHCEDNLPCSAELPLHPGTARRVFQDAQEPQQQNPNWFRVLRGPQVK